jgi:hypothetical protein
VVCIRDLPTCRRRGRSRPTRFSPPGATTRTRRGNDKDAMTRVADEIPQSRRTAHGIVNGLR